MRSLVLGCTFVVLFISYGCKKEHDRDESLLHGTWVKGSNFGDTLSFMKKDGRNIIRIPDFGPVTSTYSEKEYRLNSGELSIRLYSGSSSDYIPISSFTWTDPGKEFTLLNIQLFSFMSSMVTFKYKKI